MAKRSKGGKGGGARKYGRNQKKCQEYLSRRTRIKNRLRKFRSKIQHLPEAEQKSLIRDFESKLGRKREK